MKKIKLKVWVKTKVYTQNKWILTNKMTLLINFLFIKIYKKMINNMNFLLILRSKIEFYMQTQKSKLEISFLSNIT